MDKVLRHILRAPGDGDDWVDLPKIIALGILSEDHDNFSLYYARGKRADAIRDAIAEAS